MLQNVFQCTRCGFCCQGETTVSLSADDRKRMADFLGLSEDETAARYWRIRGNSVQMKVVDGHCIFYKDGCSVHPVRPWRCVQWPLHPSIRKDAANFQIIQDSCPGIMKGISYTAFCNFLDDIEKVETEDSMS